MELNIGHKIGENIDILLNGKMLTITVESIHYDGCISYTGSYIDKDKKVHVNTRKASACTRCKNYIIDTKFSCNDTCILTVPDEELRKVKLAKILITDEGIQYSVKGRSRLYYPESLFSQYIKKKAGKTTKI